MYVSQWSENQKYADYLKSCPKGFDDMGRVGVSGKYISHLMKFSQMVNSNQSFTNVMEIAARVSPSLRYYLLTEFRKRNAGNIPQNVKDQCAAVNKVLKDVILFPKETKGQNMGQKR